jgi:hypothetical protein
MRGENCCIASCTATVITVSTIEISVTSAAMNVVSNACDVAGGPVSAWGIRS